MLRRGLDLIGDIIRQADLVLLGLCCAATAYGLVMIASATNYMGTMRYVVVQLAAWIIGIVLYFLVSLVDVTVILKNGSGSLYSTWSFSCF